jgi:hypothetical protein
MQATPFEYRFRFWIQCLIYLLGFTAPWTYLPVWTSGLTAQAINEPAWLAISTLLFRQGWLAYNTAVMVLLILALVLTALGAWFRVSGAAYIDVGAHHSKRSWLHLGLVLHTIGIAILMPPSGALVAIVLMGLFELRLVLAEESPALAPQTATAAVTPHWLRALLSQIYFIGAFLTLAIFGWGFDRTVFRQGLLVSLGVAIIVRAFLATPQRPKNTTLAN